MKLNKQNLENLLRVLNVERYLFMIFGSMIDTKYSLETSSMLIKYSDSRSNVKKNLIASVEQSLREKPLRIQYASGGIPSGTTAHLSFSGGLSIVLQFRSLCPLPRQE